MTLEGLRKDQVLEFKEEDKDRWDDYVMNSGDADCYHLSGWKSVVEKTFGHKTYYYFAEGVNGDISGILPLVHLNSRVFGNFMVSLPFFNYGGICGDNNEIKKVLLKAAIESASRQNARHIEFRHKKPCEVGSLPVKTSKVSMFLTLPQNSEELWNSFASKLRSQIRKPEKEGLSSAIGREEELDSFYEVFSINMRDLGTPVYPKSFFKNILTEFPDTTWICTVYTEERRPVASGFLVGFKDRLEIPWASSLTEYNRLSPNMLLYWKVLKFACEEGFKEFDFGRSTPEEGTYRFKEQWGAKPIQLYWYYWLKDGGSLPEINPKNPKYHLAINIWKRLPVGLTKIIGPGIVRNLP